MKAKEKATNVLQNRNILFLSDDLKHSESIFSQWPWWNSLRNIRFKCWYGSGEFNLKWVGVLSPSGDVSGLFSLTAPVFPCWMLPYQSVYLLNKISWLQNERLPHTVGAGFFAGPILQKSENICFQLVCREQIFPPLSHLTRWPFEAFQGCNCLTSSFILPLPFLPAWLCTLPSHDFWILFAFLYECSISLNLLESLLIMLT